MGPRRFDFGKGGASGSWRGRDLFLLLQGMFNDVVSNVATDRDELRVKEEDLGPPGDQALGERQGRVRGAVPSRV